MIITRKNPKDENLLRQIKITKKYHPDLHKYSYRIYLNNEFIGFAEIIRGDKQINQVAIIEKFRRKGLTTYLYDYIESDLNIKLKPSKNLSKNLLFDGKNFWNNRLKKNPINYELLKEIEIERNINEELGIIKYLILKSNSKRLLGFAVYLIDQKVIEYIFIFEDFRRMGLSTFLHDYIEKDQNLKLRPSEILTNDGKLFWKNRKKRKNPKNINYFGKIEK